MNKFLAILKTVMYGIIFWAATVYLVSAIACIRMLAFDLVFVESVSYVRAALAIILSMPAALLSWMEYTDGIKEIKKAFKKI